jgi:hypothetical protein
MKYTIWKLSFLTGPIKVILLMSSIVDELDYLEHLFVCVRLSNCMILGFHGGEYEERRSLGFKPLWLF